MSQLLNNPNGSGSGAVHRDYGATASTSNTTHSNPIPDVSFSGFSPTEFMSLSEDIAHNITAVNSSSKQLEKMLKLVGTPRDLPALREKVHNLLAKTNSRIETTSKDLQRLTAVVRRGDKQQKLQLEKLTNDFRSVLEKYSTLQQRILTAMKMSYRQAQVAAAAEQDNAQMEAETAELLQRQREIQANLQFEQDMLVDRERQVRQIEADLLDVNSIMHTISTLVNAQGESVERIETTIEQAAGNVEEGRSELAKASERRQSYRRKILILLAIAVIIGIIVTCIIVSKLNS